ncbi:hypothetical protein T484DRAFT_1842028 [Baffinella frigidus]|nr:hypothetical protein T484DRAFT_1842028 [Cryptophyta sp. CCMP2293]
MPGDGGAAGAAGAAGGGGGANIGDEFIDKVTTLRANRRFMKFMREHHHAEEPTTMAPAQPSGDSLIDGFRTPLVDVNDLKHMADPSFKPDKAALWNTHKSRDGWVLAHNSVRFELGEMKRVLAALANTTLAEWQVAAVKAWWAGHATHVHEHHANEDNIFTPFLRTRIAYPRQALGRDNIFNPFLRTRITYPDKLEKDHHVNLIE